MSDVLKDFDAMKVLLWVVPGAFIALFRSFAMRGSFPSVSKDDFAAFALGSVIYYFLFILFTTGINAATTPIKLVLSPWTWCLVLIVVPAFAGFLLGLLEVSDAIGRALRKIGIRLPSPDATAWETLFRELPSNSVLLVTLKDGSTVVGRWIGGDYGSASSTDPKIMDLYLGQVGNVNAQGQYVPQRPRRGIYLAASEIRFIEVIPVD